MRAFASLVAGLLFGTGLILSGMTNPAKVQNFLDVAGAWDPSLALVMGGAVAVATVGFGLLRRAADAPLFAARFGWPTRTDLDAPLVAGAAIFGIGWGLGGLCPGPALAALPTGRAGVLAFVAAMLAGFVAARWLGASGARSGSLRPREGRRSPSATTPRSPRSACAGRAPRGR